MRIGVLTLPFHTNYGGILQAFALNEVLIRMGHEVSFITIDQSIHLSPIKQLSRYFFRFCKKYFLYKKNVDIFWEKHYNERLKEQEICRKHTHKFVNRYLSSIQYPSFKDIKESDFDAIIVGSDQIWRKKYVPVVETSFLCFAKDWKIRRIAYAPSFGSDTWEFNEKETDHCRSLIKDFDLVTVREKDGVDLCQKYLNTKAHWVLDPTLLLDEKTYIEKIGLSKYPQSKGNMLCYIIDMDEDKQKLINSIAETKHLVPFTVNSRAEDTSGTLYTLEDRIQPPVEEWLRGFFDAEYVVTDSFHACAFSLIFGKQFIVYGNLSRGLSRFYSLLDKYGLNNRIVTNLKDFTIPEDYDTKNVQMQIQADIDNSITLLNSAL